MTANDVALLIGVAIGLMLGFAFGFERGEISGIRRASKASRPPSNSEAK